MLGSVDKALLLIHALRDQGTLTVTEAAQMLEIAPSSAHRLLTTLVFRDFAVRDERHVYHGGPALGLVPGGSHPLTRLRTAALPHMERLSALVGETVNLVVRLGHQVRIVADVESDRLVRVADQEGTVLPAHLTSGGKALLAAMSDDDLDALYERRTPPQDRGAGAAGITDEAWVRLRRDLEGVRRFGYALNHRSVEADVSAIGCIVGQRGEEPVGAVSIAMPSVRYRADAVPWLAGELRATCAAIADDLTPG